MNLEEIRERLSDRNLSEVARRLHVSKAYISNIANGKQVPSKNMQERLTEYLSR